MHSRFSCFRRALFEGYYFAKSRFLLLDLRRVRYPPLLLLCVMYPLLRHQQFPFLWCSHAGDNHYANSFVCLWRINKTFYSIHKGEKCVDCSSVAPGRHIHQDFYEGVPLGHLLGLATLTDCYRLVENLHKVCHRVADVLRSTRRMPGSSFAETVCCGGTFVTGLTSAGNRFHVS